MIVCIGNLKPGDRFFYNMLFGTTKREFIVMDTSTWNVNFEYLDYDSSKNYRTCIDLVTGEPYSLDVSEEVEVIK